MKRILSIFNKLVGKSGYVLGRRPDTLNGLRSQSPRPSAGWIIEVIGTQGVGKTTLISAVYPKLRKNWFVHINLVELGPSAETNPELETLHQLIFFELAKDMQAQSLEPWKTLTTMRQKARVISESLTILTHSFPRGFVLDDGLFKALPEEVLKLASDGADPLWRNRAFVYLKPKEVEFAVARYQGRISQRYARGLPQSAPSDEEVRERVEVHTKLYDRLIEKAEEFGCPNLTVYAEDDVSENVAKILRFEELLLEKR